MAASNVSSDEILKKDVESPEKHCSVQTFVKSEDDKLEIDLSVKCRGCFVEDPEMHYLFTVFDQQLSLADILMQTTHYVCREDDGFPPYLCTKCTTSLIDFFNFKIQFQKTDIYVRTLLGKSSSVSFENVGIKTEVQDESDAVSNVEDFVPDEPCEITDDIEELRFMPDITKISGTDFPECKLCNENFKDASECDTHMAKEHGLNPFLKYHLFRKVVADNEKAMVQARKRKRLVDANLRDEMLLNMPGKLCRICQKKFPEEEFKAHWDSHKINICEECGYKCIKKSDLDIHKQCVHNDVRNFGCSLCEKTFKTKPLLKRHQIVHLNPRTYCCDFCGQRFNDSGTLKTHVHLRHIGNRDFICPICGLAFPMKSTLEKHIMRHNKNRPPSFYCDNCSSAFKDKSSLKRHHMVKHTSDYIRPSCDHCGRSYCSNTKLRYHIERHHSGIKIERKKREPRKPKVEDDYSSERSESQESSDSFEQRRRPKVRNVSEDFYERSPRYQSQEAEEASFFEYKKEPEYAESEEETESNNSESD